MWVSGRSVVAVRDPEGLVENTLLLPVEVALLLDGKRDAVDVQVEYARRHRGALLFTSDLTRMVEELDRWGLLDTGRARARWQALEEAFHRAPERPPYFAEKSYPEDPARCGRRWRIACTRRTPAGFPAVHPAVW